MPFGESPLSGKGREKPRTPLQFRRFRGRDTPQLPSLAEVVGTPQFLALVGKNSPISLV
jgi:hypothetical protein